MGTGSSYKEIDGERIELLPGRIVRVEAPPLERARPEKSTLPQEVRDVLPYLVAMARHAPLYVVDRAAPFDVHKWEGTAWLIKHAHGSCVFHVSHGQGDWRELTSVFVNIEEAMAARTVRLLDLAAKSRPAPTIGQRVRLVHDIDRYPFCGLIPKGSAGVVTQVRRERIAVKMDDVVHGLEEYENQVYWEEQDEGDHLCDYYADVEPEGGVP